MRQWAKERTAAARDDIGKARRLFDALMKNADENDSASWLTAQQAFTAWQNGNPLLNCQDYAFVYVSLARSVGLKAYYALVRKDYQDSLFSHAWAGVFSQGELLLV